MREMKIERIMEETDNSTINANTFFAAIVRTKKLVKTQRT